MITSKLKKKFTKDKDGRYVAKRAKGDFAIWKDGRGYKLRFRAYGETYPKEIRWASTLENAMEACARHDAWEEKIKVSALIDKVAETLRLMPTVEKRNTLLRLFNIVESDIARDYFPIYATQKVDTVSGIVAYKHFDFHAHEIKGVYDEAGNCCKYELFPTYVKTVPGTIRIKYKRGTRDKTIDGESDYKLCYFDVLVFGLLTEYASMIGDLDQADIYKKEFDEKKAEMYERIAKEKRYQ